MQSLPVRVGALIPHSLHTSAHLIFLSGLLKKRKKAKLETVPKALEHVAPKEESGTGVVEAIAEAPETAIVAAVVGAAVGAVAAASG